MNFFILGFFLVWKLFIWSSNINDSLAGYSIISCMFLAFFFFLLRFYLFIRRERGREGEREGEKHQCVAAFCTPPTGDLACNPGMYPDWESNWPPFGSQAGTQSTETHQPRLVRFIILPLFHPQKQGCLKNCPIRLSKNNSSDLHDIFHLITASSLKRGNCIYDFSYLCIFTWLKKGCSIGRVAPLTGASTQYANVAVSVPGQSTYKN